MRYCAPLLIVLLLSACVKSLPESKWAADAPIMRPEQFFDGISRGNGVIQTPDGTPSRTIRVESRGAALPDGSFRLDQTITDDRGEVSNRYWIMKQTGSNSYTSSLSDAAGAVKGEVRGNFVSPQISHEKAIRDDGAMAVASIRWQNGDECGSGFDAGQDNRAAF